MPPLTDDGRGYVIRELNEDETGLLKDFLYEAIFVPEGVAPPPRDIIELPKLQVYTAGFGTDKDDHCLVAELDDRVVGAVWVRTMEGYGHVDDETPVLSISLYSQYRGRGIGTRLLLKMLDLLRTRGYERVSLSVQRANRAVRMYRAAGFATVAENGDEYVMVCQL